MGKDQMEQVEHTKMMEIQDQVVQVKAMVEVVEVHIEDLIIII